MKRMLAAV